MTDSKPPMTPEQREAAHRTRKIREQNEREIRVPLGPRSGTNSLSPEAFFTPKPPMTGIEGLTWDQAVDYVTHLEAQLKELREASDPIRLFAYGVVTANDGAVPPDQTIYLRNILGRLDQAIKA